MAKDEDYIQLINTARWRRLRKAKLTASPVCERCKEEGRLTAASEVHHITPVEEAAGHAAKLGLMYDPGNLRALCHDCHVRTHTEMGRGGRAATKTRNERQLKTIITKFYGDDR